MKTKYNADLLKWNQIQSWFYDKSCLTVPFKSFTMASRLKRHLIGKLIKIQHWINFLVTNVKSNGENLAFEGAGNWFKGILIVSSFPCFFTYRFHSQNLIQNLYYMAFNGILWQDYGRWKNLCSQQIAKSRKWVRAALKMSSVRMTSMIILWHKNNMITLMWCYDNWQMLL